MPVNVFFDLKRHDDAFAGYDNALELNPDLADAWLGRGNVFVDLRCHDEALTAYRKALAVKPNLAEAWLGRGNVFFDLKRADDSLAAYDKALALDPDLAEAWLGRGNVFFYAKRYEDAFVAYDKALALKPDLEMAEGARLHAQMHFCDWSNFDSACARLISSLKDTQQYPFIALGIPSSAQDQLHCATLWASRQLPASIKPKWNGEIYRHAKVRVGYVSGDFHQHPIPSLTAGMFEAHNKARFEITGISIGPNDSSELRKRLQLAFDKFIDAEALNNDEIASLIRKDEIDILVDLSGLTGDARTAIFARRPAPIQINYLGYPGTMGADYIDYLIADHTLIPGQQQQFYTEKIVYLPHCYQANDDKRVISNKVFTREECGLPEKGPVFCCFNNTFKIAPEIFDCWMQILNATPDSVLWLFEDSNAASSKLRTEAATRGIDPTRLVFAQRLPPSEHLARHRMADLFLDTMPYNAHTTASDALWAGLPLLTQIGETFAGRVAASLLTAIGLPELITTTRMQYIDLAVELATNSEKLAAVKSKLASHRLTTSLFNTQLFTRHIEAAYETIYERYQAGLPPDHVEVAPFV
jgi:predicted O-linked N-acetylglucosamine transferase (SPINDLY family)